VSASPLDADTVVVVRIDALRPADSPRSAGEKASHIQLLAETAETLPPILVHRSTMRVIDGMHRLRAARLRGDDRIRVTFFDGSEQDAFIHGLTANIAHGLPLSLADRKLAAARVIRYYPTWSDRAIAVVAGLSGKTVAVIRRQLGAEIPHADKRIGRDGRLRPTNTAGGRRIVGKVLADNPGASLREIARAADISVETARNARARVKQGTDPVLPPRPGHNGNATTVADLFRDPVLRCTPAGSALLRLLSLHTMPSRDWRTLTQTVPDHCREAAASAAEECAVAWRKFADELRSST
jgi:ParB-like chromosome segregation protein Spo0J